MMKGRHLHSESGPNRGRDDRRARKWCQGRDRRRFARERSEQESVGIARACGVIDR